MTHRGMYTPLRVPMGASDAVAYCQRVVEEVFGGLVHVGVLAWLDDFLGYAASEKKLCDILDAVMVRCAEYGLKLHPKKCEFFATWETTTVLYRDVPILLRRYTYAHRGEATVNAM